MTLRVALAAAAIVLVTWRTGGAEDATPRLEVSTPRAPIRSLAGAASPALTEPRRSTPSAAAARPGGVGRTIRVTQPPRANASRQFVFRDRTERAAPAAPLPLAQRRAAVEAYRQSLVVAKGASRQR